jgi:uncharacterized membrane protein YdjX (TVP38/TMEM64 family)
MRWALLWTVLVAAVLIPFFLFQDQFNALADRLTQGAAAGWTTIIAIAALLASDVFLPIPSSIVSTMAGVMLGFWRGALTVWVGMMAGSLLGYWVGARASGAARRFLGAESIARASKVVERYGDWAIVVSRPVPVLAEASVIFAGLIRAPYRRFLLLTATANLGIALGYSAIGAFSMRVESFVLAFLGAIAVPGLAMGAARLWLGRRTQPR